MRNSFAILLSFLISFSSFVQAESPEQTLARFYEEVSSVRANFTQVQRDADGLIIDVFEGNLWMQRPNRFRWEYLKPYRQTIVADGLNLWLYDEDLAQVTVRALSDSLQGTPARLLGGDADLIGEFELVSGNEDAKIQWVGMVPRSDEGDFERIDVGFIHSVPEQLRLLDKLGQETWIQLSAIDKNKPINSSQFEFAVPDGVELVGDPAQPNN